MRAEGSCSTQPTQVPAIDNSSTLNCVMRTSIEHSGRTEPSWRILRKSWHGGQGACRTRKTDKRLVERGGTLYARRRCESPLERGANTHLRPKRHYPQQSRLIAKSAEPMA